VRLAAPGGEAILQAIEIGPADSRKLNRNPAE